MESNFFVAKKSTTQSVDFVKITWQQIRYDYRTLMGVNNNCSDEIITTETIPRVQADEADHE